MQVRLQGRHRAVQGGRRVLLLGAGIGAFIYGFVPTELLEGLAGADNLWAIPLAARDRHPHVHPRGDDDPHRGDPHGEGRVSGRRHRAHPGRRGLFHPRGVAFEQHIKKPMVVTFVLCILLVAIGTGFAFTLVMP